jgi:cysteine-rich repeat protein
MKRPLVELVPLLVGFVCVAAACGGSGGGPLRDAAPDTRSSDGPATDVGGTSDGPAGSDVPAGDAPAGSDGSGGMEGGAGDVTVDPDAVMVDCMGKPDGTDCGGGSICVANMCVSSRCGDGFRDPATSEDCEDGNTMAGDGCFNCRFECKADTDCEDGNACNGAETCDKSMAGKQLCKAGTAPAAGAACTVEGGAGVCAAGTCVKAGCGNGTVEAGEQCDDMNADDADGCTRTCKFTCSADADCSDGNMCTGVETCNTTNHRCNAGTAVTCMAATGSCAAAGTCLPRTGACRYADGDGDGRACNMDCNDADPAVFPGGFECRDGKDNDCNAATLDATAPGCECYLDLDRDGYAVNVNNAIASPGSCPAGYTRLRPEGMANIDCAGRVASAHPGQMDFFPKGYCTLGLVTICGAISFDYNCDTMETPFDATPAAPTCVGVTRSALVCQARSGWVGAVPTCGMPGTYRQCSWSPATGACSGTDIPGRTQECH